MLETGPRPLPPLSIELMDLKDNVESSQTMAVLFDPTGVRIADCKQSSVYFTSVQNELVLLQKIGEAVFRLTFVIPRLFSLTFIQLPRALGKAGAVHTFQWPLTLVCPDTYDVYLQDTEGRQAAMSGFYYGLQMLGTVSLIKQISLEGKATEKEEESGESCAAWLK